MGRSLLAGFVFFAIFVAGIITGGFLMARWAKHQVQAQKNKQQQTVVVPLGPMMVRQLLNQLDLTRDQHRAVNKTLLESTETMRVLRRESDFALDRLREEVARILSPDQRVKFEQLTEEQRAKLQEQRERVHRFLENSGSGGPAPALPQNPPAAAPTPTVPAPAH